MLLHVGVDVATAQGDKAPGQQCKPSAQVSNQHAGHVLASLMSVVCLVLPNMASDTGQSRQETVASPLCMFLCVVRSSG